jgi:hypothetical protein
MKAAALAVSLIGLCTLFHPVVLSAQKKDRDRIAREELLQAADKFQDLYLAIRSLRPHFLAASRGTRSVDVQPGTAGSQMCRTTSDPGCSMRSAGDSPSPLPILYVDGSKMGDLELLRDILTRNVEEVKYLNPNQAGSEFGVGHDGGAVLVRMVTVSKPPPAP